MFLQNLCIIYQFTYQSHFFSKSILLYMTIQIHRYFYWIMPKDFLQSLWAHTFCNTFCSKTSLRRSLLLKRVPISRIMPNPITMNISGIHLTPHKTKLSTTFQPLLLFYHLKNIKFQIIALICRPQDRVIRSLRAELDLAQTLVCGARRLADRLCKKLLRHEMWAGTGRQIAAILYQL